MEISLLQTMEREVWILFLSFYVLLLNGTHTYNLSIQQSETGELP